MIRNKQVNIWRGPDTPPTQYHIWFKDEQSLLRFDETVNDWVVFLDSGEINEIIRTFFERLDNLTINGHSIFDSPELDGSDLRVGEDGHYVTKENTLQDAVLKLDSLLTTKVYGQ